ncbi:MAG: NAD(+)/NADH kinase [Eubacteriales bacterium]
MKKVAILPNYLKDESICFAKKLSDYLGKKGCNVKILGEKDFPDKDDDFAVVLGGDGTILRACKKFYDTDTPIFGINFGHMGYLTECLPDEAWEYVDKIALGKYRVEKRMMIEAEVIRNEEIIHSFVALNEAVIYRAKLMKAFGMKISINGRHTDTVLGDGVIIATPTGSTSYNLTAGGPLLTPTSDNMVITPIASKSFPQSSLVVNGNDVIDVKVKIDGLYENIAFASLEVDADETFDVCDGDVVRIRRAKHEASIIRVGDRSFYQILREKLSKTDLDV